MFKKMIGFIMLAVFAVSICLAARSYAAPIEKDTLLDTKTETIILAGGCFWGIEAVFQHTKGVVDAVSGYIGGEPETATYDIVSDGNTGHAEAVKITYNPQKITLNTLLDVYFTVAHNPTQLNFQGPDYGTQYRSAVFYNSPEQKKIVETKIENLTFSDPIVTTLEPMKPFYAAEDYHQNYAAQNPNQSYIRIYDAPKIVDLQKKFPELYTK